MKLAFPSASFLIIAFAGQHAVFGTPTAPAQFHLALQPNKCSGTPSLQGVQADCAVEVLSNSIITALRADQLHELMVRLWSHQDIVDVMTMTGHGDGLGAQRLVQVFGEEAPRVMTEGDKLRLKKSGFSFMDITDHRDLGQLNAQRALRPSRVRTLSVGHATSSIHKMVLELDEEHLRADIAKLSSFWNRSYMSLWGLSSSNWIFEQVEAIFESTNTEGVRTSVRKFKHVFLQNTIIARIEGSEDADDDKEIIILSAHQDSLNYLLPFYRAPGADDDGSGSVTILQVLRSLIEYNFVPPPHVALEFHWFAAEEGGLLGSQAVAAAYEKAGANVRGMLHMDMTAFVKNGTEPIIGFFGSEVDANLTSFATQLVDTYLPLDWNMTGCGKSCGSDHMSFHKAGFPVVFATEGLFENGPHQNIHTPNDNTDQHGQYSFAHMLQFVKLGLAFVAELAAQNPYA